VLLGPTINLQRSPLGGRHFECFSEDPILTAALARAYVGAHMVYRLGTALGRARDLGSSHLEEKLGEGGMGEVWHAYDLKLRVDVSLKSLRLDLQRNDDRVEALRREVRTAREVISPNVCRIFDLVVEEDSELISMEYIDGITLTAMLVKRRWN
jgi:hypothetical protein